MAINADVFSADATAQNIKDLVDHPYTGPGIILGKSRGAGEHAVLAYWIMGRTGDSRNRVLVEEPEGLVRAQPFNEARVRDPQSVIYNAMRSVKKAFNENDVHIVSNGDQTDSVWERFFSPGVHDTLKYATFQNALSIKEHDHEGPNYRPRITGMIAIGGANLYAYSIICRNPTTGRAEHRTSRGNLDDMPNGIGLTFHTYDGDGEILPAFQRSPYAIPVGITAEDTLNALWDYLDNKNRVSLAVKTVHLETGQVDIAVKNQLDPEP